MRDCPAGLQFHEELGICDFDYKTKCHIPAAGSRPTSRQNERQRTRTQPSYPATEFTKRPQEARTPTHDQPDIISNPNNMVDSVHMDLPDVSKANIVSEGKHYAHVNVKP